MSGLGNVPLNSWVSTGAYDGIIAQITDSVAHLLYEYMVFKTKVACGHVQWYDNSMKWETHFKRETLPGAVRRLSCVTFDVATHRGFERPKRRQEERCFVHISEQLVNGNRMNIMISGRNVQNCHHYFELLAFYGSGLRKEKYNKCQMKGIWIIVYLLMVITIYTGSYVADLFPLYKQLFTVLFTLQKTSFDPVLFQEIGPYLSLKREETLSHQASNLQNLIKQCCKKMTHLLIN